MDQITNMDQCVFHFEIKGKIQVRSNKERCIGTHLIRIEMKCLQGNNLIFVDMLAFGRNIYAVIYM